MSNLTGLLLAAGVVVAMLLGGTAAGVPLTCGQHHHLVANGDGRGHTLCLPDAPATTPVVARR